MDNQTPPPAPIPSPPTPTSAAPLPTPLTIPELPHAPEKLLTEQATPSHKASWGPLIGIVIIVLLLIIGALYFWGAQLAAKDTGSADDEIPAEVESEATQE